MIVVVVEVTRKAYLASIAPVIVNAILNEHQVIADIVAFVSYGDFPRSRLGEKQRGKVLASWVTRKLRTMAQFSIREMEGRNFDGPPLHRASKSSKPGSIMGQSARRSTLVPDEAPRSPALATAPPLLETPSEPSMTQNTSGPTPEVPQIAEPQAPAPPPPPPVQLEEPVSNGAQNEPPRGHRRDFSFDFGDFGGQSTTAPAQPGIPATELPYRPGPEYQQPPGGPPSQFPQRGDSMQARPPSGPDESDWTQEALMYQSAFETDDRKFF